MTLDDLFETVKHRAASDPQESWTAKLMAMLHARGVEWRDVVNELAHRQGQSGIAEKASRG
jgi:phosphoribosyl-ATP pyrophosphohydrolase